MRISGQEYHKFVNNRGGFGTWACAELTEVYAIEREVGRLIDATSRSAETAT